MNKLHVAASVLIGIFYNCVCGGTYFRYPFGGLIAGDTALLIIVYPLTILSAIRGLRWLR
ncbi:hypothetical protein [Paenibacillus larvae]|uniref:hypothetical protein n=1 Tax=Paenibacillus larvae TaxID=1464 RepID=UPI00288E8E33|nr:hypothetical protein [Paenibacillus larvae]MDT2193388.1 hypothetical protein [Paenibacillus larvae]